MQSNKISLLLILQNIIVAAVFLTVGLMIASEQTTFYEMLPFIVTFILFRITLGGLKEVIMLAEFKELLPTFNTTIDRIMLFTVHLIYVILLFLLLFLHLYQMLLVLLTLYYFPFIILYAWKIVVFKETKL